MTETPPEAGTTHPWLPLDRCRAWLRVDAGNVDELTNVETCRTAAADYCEQQRRDLLLDEAGEPVTVAGEAAVMAGVLATARLFGRRESWLGLASFGEFGAADILRIDPDVARLLGTGRHARPKVG